MSAAPDDIAWRLFASCVAKRLEVGKREYADRSFSSDPGVLVAELQEEALDLAGWGFILYTRLRAMQKAIEAVGVIFKSDDKASNDLDDAG